MIKNVKQRKLDLSKIQGFIFKFKLRPVRDAAYNSATIDGLLGFNRPLLKDFNYS